MKQPANRQAIGADWHSRLMQWVRRRVWRMDIHPTAHIAASALIDRTWPQGVHIGPHCVIEQEAIVLTHDMTRAVYCDTHIGEGTHIGPRAVILPGVTIGRDARVRAGALVNKDVPDGATVIGNPARVIEEAAGG